VISKRLRCVLVCIIQVYDLMGEGGIDSPNACSIRQSLSEHGLGDVIVGLLQTQMTLPRVQHQAAGIVARLAYDDDEVHF